MREPAPERPPAWERVVDVVETLGALVACVGIVTLPVVAAVVVAIVGLARVAPLVAAVAAAVIYGVPALVPVADQPQLDGWQRWGTNVGRFLRAPLAIAARRRHRRLGRALGAATASSSTAAIALSGDTRRVGGGG